MSDATTRTTRSQKTAKEAGGASIQTSTPKRTPKSRRRVREAALVAASILVLVIVWQVASMLYGALLVPAPSSVGLRVLELLSGGHFYGQTAQTLLRVGGGLVLSVLLATVVGVPMGLGRNAEKFFEPYVLLGLTIPGLSWALLAVMIVGITNWAPVVAIVATTTPMVILNFWQGTKSIDRATVQMAQSLGASRRLTMREVVLPQLAPFALAGVRLGLALAWKIVVLSEMFGLSSGVGYQLNLAFARFSILDVVAWTLAFTVVMGSIEFLILRPVERYVTRWHALP